MPITGTDFAKKWAIQFADNEFQNITEGTFREFAADVKLLCENVTAPTTATGDVAVVALKLPMNVFSGGWYLSDTGVWEARQAFNAQAVPKEGTWWRLVVPFSTDTKVSVANITDATEAGRKMLLATDAAVQLGLVDKLAIKAGDYGNHPGFTTAYGGDGNLGLLLFLLQTVMTLKGVQTVVAPAAPTNGRPDDAADTFAGDINPAYPALGDYEIYYPGSNGNQPATNGRADLVGNVLTIRGLTGPIDADAIGIRVAASGSRPASQWLTNKKAFTGTVTVTPPPSTNTPPTVSASAQVMGTSVKLIGLALDADGVASIFLKVFDSNGALMQTFGPSVPGDTQYVTSWPSGSAGDYTVRAIATDSKGLPATSAAASFTLAAVSAPSESLVILDVQGDDSLTINSVMAS